MDLFSFQKIHQHYSPQNIKLFLRVMSKRYCYHSFHCRSRTVCAHKLLPLDLNLVSFFTFRQPPGDLRTPFCSFYIWNNFSAIGLRPISWSLPLRHFQLLHLYVILRVTIEDHFFCCLELQNFRINSLEQIDLWLIRIYFREIFVYQLRLKPFQQLIRVELHLFVC